jgi:hypothetical protein
MCPKNFSFYRWLLFFDHFKYVSKIIIAENAPRILTWIHENMKARPFLNLSSNFQYDWLDSSLMETGFDSWQRHVSLRVLLGSPHHKMKMLAELNRPQNSQTMHENRRDRKMGSNLLSAVCRAQVHKILYLCHAVLVDNHAKGKYYTLYSITLPRNLTWKAEGKK